MLNKMLGLLEDKKIESVLGEHVSYYNEGELDFSPTEYNQFNPMPCIEVFCYYGRSLVERNYKELEKRLEAYESACVDFEHFPDNEGFSRIMVYMKQETPLYEALAYAKILSEYGCTEYGLLNLRKGAK